MQRSKHQISHQNRFDVTCTDHYDDEDGGDDDDVADGAAAADDDDNEAVFNEAVFAFRQKSLFKPLSLIHI